MHRSRTQRPRMGTQMGTNTGTQSSGFTIIELMIVVVLIAILASIALPNMLSARVAANETAAIASLRTISSAQAQYQVAGRADVDADGTGEFGTLSELAGSRAGRTDATGATTATSIPPAVLSRAFGVLNANGEATKSGYLFRAFLPGQGGGNTTESAVNGDLSASVDVDTSETIWCIYAWPEGAARSGNRTFFINQRGDISATSGVYSGSQSLDTANAGAAFEAGGATTAITGATALGVVGVDGNLWTSTR